jgi:hypothetical protein
MDTMSGNKVIKLYDEFCMKTDYKSKLAFFDSHFNVIPFSFSSFDPNLQFLNSQSQINLLNEIYKKESSHSIPLKKEFVIKRRSYVFDATPINSCPPVFNNFVLNKLISQDKKFNARIKSIEQNGHFEQKPVSSLLKECDEVLELIQKQLFNTKRRSFRVQLITVFLSGYNDCLSGLIKVFRYRKKIIELYLYAQGVLYCKYRQTLQLRSTDPGEIKNFFECRSDAIVGWPQQVLLLKEMGILDLLRDKTNNSFEPTATKKLEDIVCRIIGQELTMADYIANYLKLIEKV